MTEPTTHAGCLFCDRTQHEEIGASASWRVLFDNFPANPGHVLLVPKRHVESVFDLCGDEAAELHGVRAYARNLVVARLGREPDGWTIGINEARAAGRSIDHVHEHLIPRYDGDVPDPRGGIRQCAPNCNPDAWMASPDWPGDPQHTGGNAEDCAICRPLIDQPGGVTYPWHCTAGDPDDLVPPGAPVKDSRAEIASHLPVPPPATSPAASPQASTPASSRPRSWG